MSIQTAAIDHALEHLLGTQGSLTLPGMVVEGPATAQDVILAQAITHLGYCLDRSIIADHCIMSTEEDCCYANAC